MDFNKLIKDFSDNQIKIRDIMAEKPIDVLYEPSEDNITVNRYEYKCIVCGKPNNYWWMYCKEHELQCLRDME